jgi:hypothetical protein
MRSPVWTLAILIGLALPAAAATPGKLAFQGRLVDPSTKNPKNGAVSLTFRICDTLAASCAAPLWTETQSINVTNGQFAVQLGSVTAISSTVFSGSARFLEIQIGAETLSPREQLGDSAFSFRAAVADDVDPGSQNYIQSTTTFQTGAQPVRSGRRPS